MRKCPTARASAAPVPSAPRPGDRPAESATRSRPSRTARRSAVHRGGSVPARCASATTRRMRAGWRSASVRTNRCCRGLAGSCVHQHMRDEAAIGRRPSHRAAATTPAGAAAAAAPRRRSPSDARAAARTSARSTPRRTRHAIRSDRRNCRDSTPASWQTPRTVSKRSPARRACLTPTRSRRSRADTVRAGAGMRHLYDCTRRGASFAAMPGGRAARGGAAFRLGLLQPQIRSAIPRMIAQNATPSTTAGISPRALSRSGDAPSSR